MRAKWCDQLCEERKLNAGGLSELSGVNVEIVKRILARRWTPSPTHRISIATVFAVSAEEVVWGHEALVEQNIKDAS